MFGQRPRSYPVVLALCAVFLLLFGLSGRVSRRMLPTHGPALTTTDGYTVERVEEEMRVNQSKASEEQSGTEGNPTEEVTDPDFYSDAYWSTSLEKRSEVHVNST